jgi:hypothetical protein
MSELELAKSIASLIRQHGAEKVRECYNVFAEPFSTIPSVTDGTDAACLAYAGDADSGTDVSLYRQRAGAWMKVLEAIVASDPTFLPCQGPLSDAAVKWIQEKNQHAEAWQRVIVALSRAVPGSNFKLTTVDEVVEWIEAISARQAEGQAVWDLASSLDLSLTDGPGTKSELLQCLIKREHEYAAAWRRVSATIYAYVDTLDTDSTVTQVCRWVRKTSVDTGLLRSGLARRTNDPPESASSWDAERTLDFIDALQSKLKEALESQAVNEHNADETARQHEIVRLRLQNIYDVVHGLGGPAHISDVTVDQHHQNVLRWLREPKVPQHGIDQVNAILHTLQQLHPRVERTEHHFDDLSRCMDATVREVRYGRRIIAALEDEGLLS